MLNLFEKEIRCDKNKTLPKVNVTIHDINIRVRYRVGDTVPRDASCNSEYMTGAMRRVSAAMRRKYSWVPMSVVLYLVLDNAGVHGTNECIADYVTTLKNEYNIECVHQTPRSPFTNALDLGVWATLQSEVERRHFMKRYTVDALVNTVMAAWTEGDLDDVITKVFDRIKRVLVLINEGKGGNDLVETKRGVAHDDIKFDFKLNSTNIEKANEHTIIVEDEDDEAI